MHPGLFCQTFKPKRLLFVLVETFFLSKGGLYLLLLFVALLRGRSLTLVDQMMDVARLTPGEGVVYFGGLRQAVKIKVPLTNIIDKEKKDRTNAEQFH